MKTLCHGSDKLYATTSDSFLVVECAECKLVRLFPRPTPEQLKSYYPENYWFEGGADTADRLADSWRRLVLRDHVRFVLRALEEAGGDGRILDVGCGGGLLLRELGLPEARLAGLDYSVDAASVAWGANGVPAVCGTLPRAPFAAGTFKVVTMFHVLEHLYDPTGYVEAAREMLAPGGRLVVQVPNAGCWQFLLFGENWNGLDIPRHLINFKESDLRNLLDHCGFEVEHVKHFSLRDNPAGMATSMVSALDPMSRRVRGVKETPRKKLFKDVVYFLLLLISIPFTMLEALAHAGSTIMIQAKVKDESPQ